MITLKTKCPQGTLGGFSSSIYLSEGPPLFPLHWRGSLPELCTILDKDGAGFIAWLVAQTDFVSDTSKLPRLRKEQLISKY